MNVKNCSESTTTLPPLSRAQQEIALAQIPLARRLAWRWFQMCSRATPLDELRSAAMLGLVSAAAHFVESRGVPFGAFATMAIKQHLIKAVDSWLHGGPLGLLRYSDLPASGDDFDAVCPRTRESIEQAFMHEQIERVRGILPPRMFAALRLYYGDDFTLQEIADKLGVSRERVRQMLLEGVALARAKLAE